VRLTKVITTDEIAQKHQTSAQRNIRGRIGLQGWIKKISDMHLFDKGWNALRDQIFEKKILFTRRARDRR